MKTDVTIDLEVPLLPEALAVREGFVIFHTLNGTLHRRRQGVWEDCTHLLPFGKVWFTPQHALLEWSGTHWVPLGTEDDDA